MKKKLQKYNHISISNDEIIFEKIKNLYLKINKKEEVQENFNLLLDFVDFVNFVKLDNRYDSDNTLLIHDNEN